MPNSILVYTRKPFPWTQICRKWKATNNKAYPLRRCVIETDRPIVVRDGSKNAIEKLLTQGRHLVSFSYGLYAMPPRGNKWDCFEAATVFVYHSNLHAILTKC